MRAEVMYSALPLRRGLRGEGGERDIVLTVALLFYYTQPWRGVKSQSKMGEVLRGLVVKGPSSLLLKREVISCLSLLLFFFIYLIFLFI